MTGAIPGAPVRTLPKSVARDAAARRSSPRTYSVRRRHARTTGSFARDVGGRFEVSPDLDATWERLAASVDQAAATDLDELPDDVVRDLLRRVQRQVDRLTAFRAKATGTLQSRLVRAAGVGKENRGIQETREFLTNDLRLAPSEAKRTERTGSGLKHLPATQRAFDDGDLREEHVKVIADTVRRLSGDVRDEVERKLIDAARDQDPVALGRTARRLLAEVDYDRAVEDERRRHARRSARMAQLPDGGVALHALLYGVAAERAVTAMKAFEQPDLRSDPKRTPEQRAADALDQIFDVALRAGEAPTQHGVRPHVAVTISFSDLAVMAGVAELEFTGPITMAELRGVVTDSTITRVIINPESQAVEVGKKTRLVPAALWTTLKLRDKGCAWAGCTAPPGWCEVAHGNNPFRAGGLLSIGDAVLLCKRHHRIFDAGGWKLEIDGNDVRFVRITADANAPP